MSRWRDLMLQTLLATDRKDSEARRELRRAMRETWTGRASVDSAAYRIVREFRTQVGELAFAPLIERIRQVDTEYSPLAARGAEGALWALVSERPLHLLDPKFKTWTDLLLAAADRTAQDAQKAGGIATYVWGRANTVRIRHPPSGLIVIAEESRSQIENRARALRRLRKALALRVRHPMPANGIAEAVRVCIGRNGRLRVGQRDARYLPAAAAVRHAPRLSWAQSSPKRSARRSGARWTIWKRCTFAASSTTVESAMGSRRTMLPFSARNATMSSQRPTTRRAGSGLPHAQRPGFATTLSPRS